MRLLTRDEARDWTAILYTPVLTICAIVLTAIMVWGPWPDDTAEQRLTFLGWALMGLLVLIALGTFFLQRRTVDIRVATPGGGSLEFDNVTAPETPKT